jgi:hypothetical protein
MGIRQRFNAAFGQEDSLEEERKRFVDRVNHVIFHEIDTKRPSHFAYSGLFDLVCFELGVNPHDFRGRKIYDPLALEDTFLPPEMRVLTGGDFTKTLEVLCALHEHMHPDPGRQEWLSQRITAIMSRCSRDIGVKWTKGSFYPSGADELDEGLVEGTLVWLKDYPNERKDYATALQYYAKGTDLSDVIENCYTAVEGVVRQVLGNKKALDNNKDELLKKLALSDGWNAILANYISYAHNYRHASEERHAIRKQEAEAYLYMTGLIIRLVIESK